MDPSSANPSDTPERQSRATITTNAVLRRGTAEDLLGRSALALLACRGAECRVLFLVSPGEAIVNTAGLDTARFARVPVSSLAALPFADEAFDGIVMDADAASRRVTDRRSAREAAGEFRRVSRPGAGWLLMARHRRVPRNRRALGEYRLRPGGPRWAAALREAGALDAAAGYVQLDGARVTVILPSSASLPGAAEHADAQLTLFHCEPPHDAFDLQQVLREVGVRLGDPAGARLCRVLIRKIGKTAVLASAGGRHFIIRIPRSPIARARAERNFIALERLHGSALLSDADRARVPRALLRGSCRGYSYYVEEIVPGRSLQGDSSASWHAEAVRFLTELHVHTRQLHLVDDARFEEWFARPVRHIRDAAALSDLPVFELLIESMRSVLGERVPFVWSHGDFMLGNCLFDAAGRLTGVVDWELFSEESLPLLDMLQCMPLPGESNSHPRWQRADAVLHFLSGSPVLDTVPELRGYVDAVGVPRTAVPALLIMYWVDHVARRIEARRTDPSWMRTRVHQPLATLRNLLGR